MATTRIIPMYSSKGRSLINSLKSHIEYGKNNNKTENGDLISTYQCSKETVVAEFALAKSEYSARTGRRQKNNVIAYQIRQSFKPGEVSPDEANRIGYELAESFTKGGYAFIVCTHTDKKHLHNHIYINSTSIDCSHKLRNFYGSGKAIMDISDIICLRHGLSVPEGFRKHGKSYYKYLKDAGIEKGMSQRERLRQVIDEILESKPSSYDDFIQSMRVYGYTLNSRENFSFSHPDNKKNIRLISLGEEYSEQSIRLIIKGSREHRKRNNRAEGIQLVSKLEDRLNTGKGYYYDLKITNEITKQQAKALLFFRHKGYSSKSDFSAFMADVDAQRKKTEDLAERIKNAETVLNRNKELQTQVINYAKTRDVYQKYVKSGYSDKFYAENESAIIIHKAAKKYFDDNTLRSLPKVRDLRDEYSKVLAQKKTDYQEYRKAKEEYQEMLIYRENLAEMLNIETRMNKNEKNNPER